MTHLAPHDVSDLLLAPLALRLDTQLEELAGLTPEELDYRISLTTDRQPRGAEQRRRLTLEMLERDVEAHDWKLSWAPRGLSLRHGDRHLVLGVPEGVREYLAD